MGRGSKSNVLYDPVTARGGPTPPWRPPLSIPTLPIEDINSQALLLDETGYYQDIGAGFSGGLRWCARTRDLPVEWIANAHTEIGGVGNIVAETWRRAVSSRQYDDSGEVVTNIKQLTQPCYYVSKTIYEETEFLHFSLDISGDDNNDLIVPYEPLRAVAALTQGEGEWRFLDTEEDQLLIYLDGDNDAWGHVEL